MECKLVKYLLAILFVLVTFPSCLEDVDFSGFITNYTPVNERFEQSMEWNQNHPDKIIHVKDENYTLFIAADVHIGGTSNFKQFLTDGLTQGADAFILAGDNVSGHKHDYDTLRNHLQKITNIPVFPITGNHDLYFKGWQYFYDYFGSSTYKIVVETDQTKDDAIICLDSGGGTLGKKQLAWLKTKLENRDKYRKCIVVTHNNFFRARHTTSTNPQIDELYLLLDWFYDYKVDLVIMGHDHQHSLEQFGPTTYITMDALKDDFKKASYLKLNVNNGEILHEFVRP